MINYANSRLDYLKAQALAQKVQMMPMGQNPYGGQLFNPGSFTQPQLPNQQPMMNQLRPRYMSNMQGQRTSSYAIGGYRGGGI